METNSIKDEKEYKLWGILFVPLGFVLGIFIVELFFRQGPFFIIIFSIPIIIIIGIPTALIILLLQYLIKPLRGIAFPTVLSIIICALIIFDGKDLYAPSPDSLLERFIETQDFRSISEIKGVIEYPAIDHIVRLSFKISPTEFNSLITRGNYTLSDHSSFPSVPYINNYNWWDTQKLKKLKQYESINNDEHQFLWYDINENIAWLMSIDT